MTNKIVIRFPLAVLIFTLSFAISITIERTNSIVHLLKPAGILQQTRPIAFPTITTTPEVLFDRINSHRTANSLKEFITDSQTCDLDPENVFGICETCIKASIIKISKYGTAEFLLSQLIDQSTTNVIDNPEITHLCIKDSQDSLSLFFTSHQDLQKPPATRYSSSATSIPTQKLNNFTEEQLWQALMDYRHAHHAPDLLKDENLCIYARHRVSEHIKNFATKPKEKYLIPEKYPLDGHAGFAQDAESNYVFDVTHRSHIAENLAYWPSAQYATHVIEWGWDSSTEGHRETQLSTEFTHACIAGSEGFYAAIFGK